MNKVFGVKLRQQESGSLIDVDMCVCLVVVAAGIIGGLLNVNGNREESSVSSTSTAPAAPSNTNW